MANVNQKQYEAQNISIGTVLNWIENGEIGLPELQRPFVWPSVKVRDLVDSLYKGFPIGYIITWNNTKVKLKNGESAMGKKIIIDGQQRITALRAAFSGEPVLNKKLEKHRIKIAFNPWTEEFQTLSAPIAKDNHWIPDISVLFKLASSYSFVSQFISADDSKSPEEKDEAASSIEKLRSLIGNDLGDIVLSSDLPIEDVTEIFNRINSKGTSLNSADFVMSKLSADTEHDGEKIRKCIDYFSKLLVEPLMYEQFQKNDPDFVQTKYFEAIKWAKGERTDLYDPDFGDIFHVVLAFKFGRGKLTDLISLISGRNFKTKEYTEEAMVDSYQKLQDGVFQFVNQSNFQRYLMILQSLGMVSRQSLALNGTGALNFGYALYLLLKNENNRNNLSNSEIEEIIKKWVIMSALTSRYSGSGETTMQDDINLFINNDPTQVVEKTIRQELPDTFWDVTLPDDRLSHSSTQANVWKIFVMSQVRNHDTAWLEKDHEIRDLLLEQGNIHHIFPKAYLKKHGFPQTQYNQIANYIWITQPRNLQISDRAPKDYLADPGVTEFGTDDSFAANAIPQSLKDDDYTDYQTFLSERRKLMANKIRAYFNEL